MLANSAARAARFIFRPSAASAGGVCVRAHRIPNAAAAAVYRRHMSELVPTRRAFLVDTHALVRGMEAHGIESKHAEAITSAITVVENIAEAFVSKGEMQKSMMIQDANLSKFKSEVQSSQDHHFSLLQRATEKLRGDIDLLYRRIHHELAKQNAETTKHFAEVRDRIAEASDRITKQIADRFIEANDQITKQIVEANEQIVEANDRFSKQIVEFTDRMTKVDREVNALRAQLPVEFHGLRAQIEAAKYDVIKYCIGTVVPITAVTLAVLCIGL